MPPSPEPDPELLARVRGLLAETTVEPDALEQLAAIRAVRRALDAEEARAIQRARVSEHDWSVIGAALGMSGQAAGHRARRHHQLDDPRREADTGRPATRGRYRRREAE